MRELPKSLGYFWHRLLSSSWSHVNKVRLVQNTKRASPKTATNNLQMFFSACILSNDLELRCYLKVQGKQSNKYSDKFGTFKTFVNSQNTLIRLQIILLFDSMTMLLPHQLRAILLKESTCKTGLTNYAWIKLFHLSSVCYMLLTDRCLYMP